MFCQGCSSRKVSDSKPFGLKFYESTGLISGTKFEKDTVCGKFGTASSISSIPMALCFLFRKMLKSLIVSSFIKQSKENTNIMGDGIPLLLLNPYSLTFHQNDRPVVILRSNLAETVFAYVVKKFTFHLQRFFSLLLSS